MPKLSELLGTRAKDSNTCAAPANVLMFAQLLDVDVKRAQALIDAHGEGYIYARGGFCMRRSKRTEQAMIRTYGYCVVFKRGELWVLDRGEARALAKKKQKEATKRERMEVLADMAERKAERVTRSIFASGMGERVRKRAKTNGALRADDKREYKTARNYKFTTIKSL